MKAAVKSFLEFYETGVHVNSKISLRRKWQKPYLSWEDAERIISKTREPYESVLRFMLWSGLGQDEVVEINSSNEIQQNIEKQMKNDKDYVIIDLEPRKKTLTRYFTAVPKRYLPKFPVHTLDYRIRGDKLVTRQVIEDRFRKAAQQVELYHLGMGPHTLMSVFESQCGMAGVKDNVIEFARGHGGGDKYGYRREVLNEEFLVKELRKLWEHTKPVTESDLRQVSDKYETLRQYVVKSLIEKLPPEEQALARARLTEMSTVEQVEEVVRKLSKPKRAIRRPSH
jgi:CRISPR/Cas system-associated protein Cas5 (RAMP superfamily)